MTTKAETWDKVLLLVVPALPRPDVPCYRRCPVATVIPYATSGLLPGQVGQATFVSPVSAPGCWLSELEVCVEEPTSHLDAERWGWQCRVALCPWWQDREPLVSDKASELFWLSYNVATSSPVSSLSSSSRFWSPRPLEWERKLPVGESLLTSWMWMIQDVRTAYIAPRGFPWGSTAEL